MNHEFRTEHGDHDVLEPLGVVTIAGLPDSLHGSFSFGFHYPFRRALVPRLWSFGYVRESPDL